jgi:hypothetical protein
MKTTKAEAVRFELTMPFGIPVFKTGALDQLCDASVFRLLHFKHFFKLYWTKKK